MRRRREAQIADSQARYAQQRQRELDLLALLRLAGLPPALAAPLLREGAAVSILYAQSLVEVATLARRALTSAGGRGAFLSSR